MTLDWILNGILTPSIIQRQPKARNTIEALNFGPHQQLSIVVVDVVNHEK